MSFISYAIWLLAFFAGVILAYFAPEASFSQPARFLFIGAWGAVLGFIYYVLCKRTVDARDAEFTETLNEMVRKQQSPRTEFIPIVPSVADESEVAKPVQLGDEPITSSMPELPAGAISVGEAFAEAESAAQETAAPASTDSEVPATKVVFPLESWEPFCKEILKNRPFSEVVDALEKALPEMFPGAAGILYMYGGSQAELHKIFSFGDYVVGDDIIMPSHCASFNLGEIVVTDFAKDGESHACTHLHHHPQGFSFCAPIEGLEEHFGILSIQTDELPAGESLELWKAKVSIVAATFGLYVANQNLNIRFLQHSIRDNLTGLFNKRYMEESLRREIFAATRHKTPIGIIMLYPDMVNAIQAEKGRHSVEQLLWELGQRLPGYIRNEDIPCRYEGDVFCVIMPGADYKITRDRAEKIRHEISQLQIAYGEGVLTTSLSLGVSVLPVHAGDVQALIETAVASMQIASANGGNRVVMAESLPQQ